MPSVARKSSRLWIAYAVVYLAGWGGLWYLLRRPHIEWFAYWMPFAFPVILSVIGVAAARAEHSEPVLQMEDPVSVLGRPLEKIRPTPPGPTDFAKKTMLLSPVFTWIFPPFTGVPHIQYVFYAWWIGCAAFVAFVLPRLGAFNPPSRASA